MKKYRILSVTLLLMILMVSFAACNKSARDNLSINAALVICEINRPRDNVTLQIDRGGGGAPWGTAVKLESEPFEVGSSRSLINHGMTMAKYKINSNEAFSIRQPRKFPAQSDYYVLYYSGLPCGLRYSVVIVYDDAQNMKEAWGTVDEVGCL